MNKLNRKTAILPVFAMVLLILSAFPRPAFSGWWGSNKDECLNNLRLIDGLKQQWALENKKSSNAVPTEKDLQGYLGCGHPTFPKCPDGGVYVIKAVSVAPRCSTKDHILP